MATTSRKSTVQRPASAMAKTQAAPAAAGYELARSPTSPLSPGSRSTKSTSRSERRRSLPAPGVAPPADSYDASGLSGLSHEQPPLSLSTRSLYERRRTTGITSPTLTLNSARSVYSDRGSDRGRVPSIAGTEDAISIHRLRSNSGLSLHTNSAALRRYTDYNADGSSRLSPTDERFDSDGRYGEELPGGGSTSPKDVGTPTTPALFSWETVRSVLDDPTARQRLWEHTSACGGTENLAFLEKVDQYNKALHSVTALMANISTTFTCMTASEPLNLPPHLAKSLNADVKHVSSSILPGLEVLFADADVHIKERILHKIYPGFVKRQLTVRMKASLGAASAGAAHTPFRFEGLGQAFCLTDPYRPDNPVVYASESFAHVMGYARSEDIPRTGRFFRGPEHHDEEKFSEDLVLSRNHRDNRPFWSLVSVCPLKTASGRVRFVLSGLIDISDAIKTQDDIVHTLSAVPPSAGSPVLAGRMNGASIMTRRAERPTSAAVSSYETAARPQSSKRDKPSSTISFFNPFSRKKRTDDSASTSPPSRWSPNAELPPRTTQPPVTARTSIPTPPPSPLLDDKLSIYSRFMVLQFVPGSSHGQDYATPAPPPPPISRRGSRYSAHSTPAAPSSSSAAVSRLKVAFSSLPMLELLGLGPAAQDAVMYHDVFAVLSELAGSPSITPVFRANVRQRIVTSESASLELSVPASGMMAPGALSAGLGAGLASPTNAAQSGGDESGTGSTSRRSSLLLSGGRSKQDHQQDDDLLGGSAAWDGKASEGWWPGSSGSRRRRSGTYDRPPTSERRGGGREAQRMQRLMSHWTPLKDVDGAVAWVILVMAPVAEA